MLVVEQKALLDVACCTQHVRIHVCLHRLGHAAREQIAAQQVLIRFTHRAYQLDRIGPDELSQLALAHSVQELPECHGVHTQVLDFADRP